MPVIAVDPSSIAAAALTLSKARGEALATVTQLSRVLVANAGMAGGDGNAGSWAAGYDPAAQSAMSAAYSYVRALDNFGFGLAITAQNHAIAENDSIIPGSSLTGYTLPTDTTLGDSFYLCVTTLPSARGPASGGGPPGWSLVQHLVAHVWPDGHQDRLNAAGDAWMKAAGNFANSQVTSLPVQFADQQSPEFESIQSRAAELSLAQQSLITSCTALGNACYNFARSIDTAHHQAITELKSLAEQQMWFFVGGVLLGAATAGIGAGASAAVDAGRITATAVRVCQILDAMVATTRVVIAAMEECLATITGIEPALAGINALRATRASTSAVGAIPRISAVFSFGDRAVSGAAADVVKAADATAEATASRTDAVARWNTPSRLMTHFMDHGSQFGCETPAEYAQTAADFYDHAIREGLPMKIDRADDTVRIYDPASNTFGSYTLSGKSRTIFKPKRGVQYWEEQSGDLVP